MLVPRSQHHVDPLRLHYDEDATRELRERLSASGMEAPRDRKPFTPRINTDYSRLSTRSDNVYARLYADGLEKKTRVLTFSSVEGLMESEKMWASYRSSRSSDGTRQPWDSATPRPSGHRPRGTEPSRSPWTLEINRMKQTDELRKRERLERLRSKSPPLIRHTASSQSKIRSASAPRSLGRPESPSRTQSPAPVRLGAATGDITSAVRITPAKIESLAAPKRPYVRPVVDAAKPVDHSSSSTRPRLPQKAAPAPAPRKSATDKASADEFAGGGVSNHVPAVGGTPAQQRPRSSPPGRSSALAGDAPSAVSGTPPATQKTASTLDLSAKRRKMLESLQIHSDDEDSADTNQHAPLPRGHSTSSSVDFKEEVTADRTETDDARSNGVAAAENSATMSSSSRSRAERLHAIRRQLEAV